MFRVLSTNQNIDALCKPNDSGIYFQPTNGGATTANGYPFPSAGVLKVYPCANNGVQQWYTAFDSNITAIRSVIGWNGNLAIWGDWEPQATKRQLDAAIAALIDSSPDELNTLGELAAAIGNDPNFATTMTNALAGKQPLDATLTNLSGKSVSALLQYLGLNDTVTKAAGAIQKSGGNMEGPLGLTRTSSFGVATENTLGGNSIAIGDSDSGFKSNGDGNIALMANSVLAGYFSANELQHRKKMLTKIFQAIAENNWTEGAGGFGSQL